MLHNKPKFEGDKGKRIMLVAGKPSHVPVFLKKDQDEGFYVRAGGSSAKLTLSQMNDYRKQQYISLAFGDGLFEG